MFTGKLFKHQIFLIMLLVVSCGTLVGNPEDDEGEANNIADDAAQTQAQVLTFNIADAPVDGAVSLFITISSIEIRKETGDWVSIPLIVQQEIDLLQYQDGNSLKFAEASVVDAGVYTETRLILSETAGSRLVLADAKTYDLKIPGGDSSGIKIKVPFTVDIGQPADLTLDFDVRKSLKVSGTGGSLKYSLSPVLRLLKHGEYGHIDGEVADGKIVCVYMEEAEADDTDDCANALNSAIVKNGKYKLPHLPKGKYKILVFGEDGQVKHENDVDDIDVEPVEYKDLKKGHKSEEKKKVEEAGDDKGPMSDKKGESGELRGHTDKK